MMSCYLNSTLKTLATCPVSAWSRFVEHHKREQAHRLARDYDVCNQTLPCVRGSKIQSDLQTEYVPVFILPNQGATDPSVTTVRAALRVLGSTFPRQCIGRTTLPCFILMRQITIKHLRNMDLDTLASHRQKTWEWVPRKTGVEKCLLFP
jgi:hypothetical protein